jgi:DNA-binding CsgD family transcriptional regulator/tetratricopeptide (TPR) repeat protein
VLKPTTDGARGGGSLRWTAAVDPWSSAGPACENLAVTSRVSCSELVGRAAELARLDAVLESIGESSGTSVVLIGGEAGIGKTRLITELCARARGSDYLTAVGACLPVEGRVLAYASPVGLLRDLERQLEGRAEAEALDPAMQALGLSSVSPTVAPSGWHARRVVADSPDSARARGMARTLTYDVVLRALVDVSALAPLVLVFEDLHWADTFTLGLVDYLSRNVRGSPIMLIGSYRSDELGKQHRLHALLAELLRVDCVTRMELSGLQGQALEQLMTAILGHHPDRARLDATSGRTGGNPFFVEELLAAGTNDLSADLREVVMARVRRLSEQCRRVLDVAAVIGSRIDHRLLARVSALSDDNLDLAVRQLLYANLLVVDDDATGYRFRHDLVREAVYGSLLPGERARLHHHVATTLATRSDLASGDPASLLGELASHWWEAGAWVEALPVCVAAATSEAAMFAFAEAQLHLERALQAWDLVGDDVASSVVEIDRAALFEQAADAAEFADSARRAMELARQAIDLIDGAAESERKAMAYARLARSAWSGDPQAAVTALETAAGLLPSDEPSLELSRILTEEASGLMLMSRYRESQERAEQAIEVCRAIANHTDEGRCLNTLGVCLVEMGRFDEGIAFNRRAVEIAEEVQNATNLDTAYNNLAHVLMWAGRLEEAAAVTLDGLARGERIGGVRLQGAALNSVEALTKLGRFGEATQLLDEIGGRLGGCHATGLTIQQARLGLAQGRFDAARDALERIDELTAQISDLQFRGAFYLLRAELALGEGRPENAYDDIERALAQAAGTDDESLTPEICALGIRALADQIAQARQQQRRRFDEDKARLLAVELMETAQRLVDAPRQRGGQAVPRAEAFALQCRAEASRLSGSDDSLWESSAAQWEALGERYNVAYCLVRQGEALLAARSAPARAAKCLRRAWRISVEIGAAPLQAKTEAIAQRARVSLDTETPQARRLSQVAADLGLTSREVEVLGYLASGKTDRQIADALFISKKTVSVHVSNLLRKLDAENRQVAGEIGKRFELSADDSALVGTGVV